MSRFTDKLTPPKWPQDQLVIPGGGGRFMPPLYPSNVDVAKRESFTMSDTFTYNGAVAGQQFVHYIPTEQDGDFWVDQIYCVAWASTIYQSQTPLPALIDIQDGRTGRKLNYGGGVPINFFATLILFPDDPGFDVASSPLPDGFRSTALLPKAFCFTRQSNIILTMTMVYPVAAGTIRTVDFAFGGWKEYEHASQG